MFLIHDKGTLKLCPLIVDKLLITNKLLIVSNVEGFVVNRNTFFTIKECTYIRMLPIHPFTFGR